MSKLNQNLVRAIAVVMIFSTLAIITLMLWPLYGHALVARTDVLRIYYATIDSVKTEYHGHDYIPYGESIIIPFIKGKQIEDADPSGKWKVYRWKIAPKDNTEYLIFEGSGYFIVRKADN